MRSLSLFQAMSCVEGLGCLAFPVPGKRDRLLLRMEARVDFSNLDVQRTLESEAPKFKGGKCHLAVQHSRLLLRR